MSSEEKQEDSIDELNFCCVSCAQMRSKRWCLT